MAARFGGARRTRVLAMLAALLLACAAPVHGARCGHRLVAAGDHQFDVLRRCGPPDYAATRVVYPFRRLRLGGNDIPGGRERGGAQPVVRGEVVQLLDIPVLIEEWVYGADAGRFGQLLRFRDGRLLEAETLGRESGLR